VLHIDVIVAREEKEKQKVRLAALETSRKDRSMTCYVTFRLVTASLFA